MKRKRRNGLWKERVIMAACAVLVMGSLTATGLWLKKGESKQEENYVVDLSKFENNNVTGFTAEGEIQIAENVTQDAAIGDDLDYDPYFQETNSGKVENPDQSESESMSDGVDRASANAMEITNAKDVEQAKAEGIEQALLVEEAKDGVAESTVQTKASPKKEETLASDAKADTEMQEIKETDAQALSTAMQPALTFSDSDTLVWPVVGNVLVNYSMDKTVYFPTLQQYKYNPAIIIQANEGDLITASAAGKVNHVFEDAQIGNAVTMELGGGYEVTYGQLTNILVSEGSYVAMGDIIGEVAAPTKYFCVEGTNVYFKLTKDGEPVNPMSKLN